jgi:hypothetical protein
MARGRLAVLLPALLLALWLAPPGLALPPQLGSYLFGARLVRAEVVVKDGGALHDYRIDRGRIRRLAPGSVTLLERDGSLQTIAVPPGAVTGLRRGMVLTTIRDGSAPAAEVRLGSSASLGNSLLGPKLVRAEVLVKEAGKLHDYRIDRGRIRVAAPGSLTLLERDATLVTIPASPTARVLVNGAPSSWSTLRRGMTATTIRDGSAPADEVRATR